MAESVTSIAYYDSDDNARRYHAKTGFDPGRKQEVLDVTLALLKELCPSGSLLLELGAGSGLFTRLLAAARHFGTIHVTDGAKAMLNIARAELADAEAPLHFQDVDFSQESWPGQLGAQEFQAVTSSMALHHVQDKLCLFRNVFDVLAPGSWFVFADHIAGASPAVDRLIGTERGRVKLPPQSSPAELEAFLQADERSQRKQGNHCGSLGAYFRHLRGAGFSDVDCVWRSYWLAVFVARRPMAR